MSDSGEKVRKLEMSDVLFHATDDWMTTASLQRFGNGWELYAIGYKEAADILVQQVTETNRQMDTLIYPIAFLYRHYLELRLKEIIVAGQDLLDQKPDVRHVHNLGVLWSDARKILTEVWPESPTDDLDAVENCINQFYTTDPVSMNFRYPVTKDGKASLSPTMTHVSIRNLAEVMNRLALTLEGASMGISVYLDEKQGWMQ